MNHLILLFLLHIISNKHLQISKFKLSFADKYNVTYNPSNVIITKISPGFQTIRSLRPLQNGKITTIKFKITSGFVLIVGITLNSTKIQSSYVGFHDQTYGFCCEDGWIYDGLRSHAKSKKCQTGDIITVKYDLRNYVDNISYKRNEQDLGVLFHGVSQGGQKKIYFGTSFEHANTSINVFQFNIEQE